VKNVRKENWIV